MGNGDAGAVHTRCYRLGQMWERLGEGHLDVGVVWFAEGFAAPGRLAHLHRPVARHGQRVPLGRNQRRLRDFAWRVEQSKLPVAVQAAHLSGVFGTTTGCAVFVAEWPKRRPRWQFAQTGELGHLPGWLVVDHEEG